MIDIKKILVPVDFSDASRVAVDYGLSLALEFNARLVLTHIVPSSTALIYTFPAESYAFEKEQARYAKSMLPSLVPDQYRERINLQTIVKVGEVRSELLGIVTDEKVDLVVMGTHGRNAFDRFMLGSLTERMLRKIPVPILTVSHLDPTRSLHDVSPVPLRHVLYATDLSDSAEAGLMFSTELARGTGARLTVLHVAERLDSLYWSAESGYLPEALTAIRDETREQLDQFVKGHSNAGVDMSPMITQGEPYREIIRVADEMKADMIVMNLQGKSLLERALLGSTAERVIRYAHTPVLSIPSEAGVRFLETQRRSAA